MNYPQLSITDTDFTTKLVQIFRDEGYVVIQDVFKFDECQTLTDDIVKYFEQLGTGINRQKIKQTWTDYNLPPQTRPGLFQCLVANSPAVWQIRSDPRLRQIFTLIYSNLRQSPINDFIVSGDGINIRPNGLDEVTSNLDWAHLDQTDRDDIYKCVQGQVVLSTTTAGFRVSPKSHLVFEKILDACGVSYNDASQWLKFTEQQVPIVKKIVTESGGTWQIPIIAPKGSVILWSSSCIHSAKLADTNEHPTPTDKYLGWRSVVYVCYRPRQDLSQYEIDTRIRAYNDNLVTNHWGTKIFQKRVGGRMCRPEQHHPTIISMLKNPLQVYQIPNLKPQLTLEQQQLLGLTITNYKY